MDSATASKKSWFSKYNTKASRIRWQNGYHYYKYCYKYFRSKKDNILFWTGVLALAWSLFTLGIGVNGLWKTNGFDPVNLIWIVMSAASFVYGLIARYQVLANWNPTPEGNSPEDIFQLYIGTFHENNKGDEVPGWDVKPKLALFPPNDTEFEGHLYITVRNSDIYNVMAYQTALESYLANGGKVRVKNDVTGGKFETETQLLRRNRDSQAEMKLALKIKSATASKSRKEPKNFFNADKVSLKELAIDASGNKTSATLGKTSYFTSAVTNDLFPLIIRPNVTPPGSKSYDMRMFYPCENRTFDGQNYYVVSPLENCQHVSNHVGSMVFALTADNYPALYTQGKHSNVSANKLVLSGTGSLEWDELVSTLQNLATLGDETQTRDSFLEFVRRGMARELLEETGLVSQGEKSDTQLEYIVRFSPYIRIISYYRDLNRGGLPIFVGFSRLPVDLSVLKALPPPKETKLVQHQISPIDDSTELQSFMENYVNPPLESRNVSDQALLLVALLKRPTVCAIFDDVMSGERAKKLSRDEALELRGPQERHALV